MRQTTGLKGIPGSSYYFVGIGGYGMSGLARILAEAGYQVRGSDARDSTRLEQLRRLGVDVAVGHSSGQVKGGDIVVYSTDVPSHNPELADARSQGLEIWHRSDLLARLINNNNGIAVAGTHGKTTVTTMISHMLLDAGLDPTVSVGGEVDRWEGTGRLGRSQWVVAEACESDGTFTKYRPQIAVVTNLEPEHLDHYGGSFQALLDAFRRFLSSMPPAGLAVLCADEPNTLSLREWAAGSVATYGFSPAADWRAVILSEDQAETRFTVLAHGEPAGEFRLRVPGRHNVLNALAAIATGSHLQIPVEAMAASLAAYSGVHRRFQVVYDGDGVMIVDDYAHHPTEIKVTLEAARQRGRGRVLALFQPQRYSRTHRLMTEFSQAFTAADHIVLLPIYSPPGEEPIPGVSSETLAGLVEQHMPGRVTFMPGKDAAVDWLLRELRTGDLVITMGAGDIWQVAYNLAERIKHG